MKRFFTTLLRCVQKLLLWKQRLNYALFTVIVDCILEVYMVLKQRVAPVTGSLRAQNNQQTCLAALEAITVATHALCAVT